MSGLSNDDQGEPSSRHAAEGFLEVGMYLDADAALDDIDSYCRHLPEVLAVRVKIYQALEKWELKEVVEQHFDVALVPSVVSTHSLQL